MKYILITYCCLLFGSIASAQEDTSANRLDTLNNVLETQEITSKSDKKTFLGFLKEDGNYPKKAAFYSIVCPGGGQIYNKQYWKVPLAFGGVATAGYFVYYNTANYRAYRDDYRFRVDDDPTTLDRFYDNPNATPDALATIRDAYRKQMEQSYIALVAIYGLNVLEAYTAAHLKHFDIDDDLSLEWQPSIKMQTTVVNTSTMSFGVTMQLVQKPPVIVLDF